MSLNPISKNVGRTREVENYQLLAQSYFNCLNVARLHNIREIAFCCISIGIFGFDKAKSARLALQSIRGWILKNPYQWDALAGGAEKIIFVTFTDQDRQIYCRIP